MAVITISRQFGAGAWTLGERLSKRLGYGCVNEDVIKEAAIKMKVSSKDVHSFEKEGASRLMKFLDKMISGDFIDRHITDKYGYVDEKRYVDVVRLIIEELYDKGNMIIIGRGGQFILKGRENAHHLLLVQELESRILFMMDRYGLTRAEAEKAIRQRDQIRDSFLSFFANGGYKDDPLLYDLVINMDLVSMEKAEDLVFGLVS